MCDWITVTYENVHNYKEDYIYVFSVKSLGYMNNTNFVALHVG